MTEEAQQETTLREDIVAAVEEVKNPPEAEKSIINDTKSTEKSITNDTENAVKDGRDDKGRFKPKESTVAKVEATPALTPPPVEDAPQALSAAAKAKWAELPPEIKSEWSKREADIHKMFTSSDGELRMGKELKEVITPYMAIIQSEGGTPATAVRDLLNTAYQLRNGTPQQKAAIVQQVIKQYGIDMNYAQQSSSEAIDPTIQQLQQQIAQLQQQANPEAIKKQLHESMENDRINSEVKAFASDPANKYYEQVKPLMANILGSGSAQTMKEAYELACRAHPTVGSMLEAEKLAAGKVKQTEDIAAKKRAATSITGSPGATIPNSGSPNRSLREELLANLRSHSS